MKEKLINVLSVFGFSVRLEGSLSDKEYPETFITFWNFTSNNNSYSNDDLVTTWGYNVRLYSKNPVTVEDTKKLILKELKRNGFIPNGKGNDFVYSSETHHIGWSVDVYYLEVNNAG